MKRLILLFWVAIGITWSQTPSWNPAVYEQVFTDLDTVPAVSGNLPSIGQSSHFIITHAKDNTPNVCVSPAGNVNVDLEVSFDGTQWFAGVMAEAAFVQTDELGNVYQYVVNGGTFPYLRLRVINLDTVNCVADIYYAGSLNASNILQARLGRVTANDAPVDNHSQILMPGAYNQNYRPLAVVNYAFDGDRADMLLDCENTVEISVGPATTAELVGLQASQSIRVCSFSLTMNAAGAVQFVEGTGANCAVGASNITGAYSLPINGFIRDGNTVGRLFTVTEGEALCLTTTGAGASAGGLLTYAQY